jgi:hypothetical protein
MRDDVKILTFIKAVEKQFYDKFINDGEICMQTQNWFRKHESTDANIGDSYEGAKIVCGRGYLFFPEPVETFNNESLFLHSIIDQMHNNNENKELLVESTDFKLFDESEKVNIFCLYSVLSSDFKQNKASCLANEKFIKEFSNHRFLFFTHPKEFLLRIENALFALGKKMNAGLVKYYSQEDNFIFDLTAFNKLERYSYQKEFRLAIENELDDIVILKIGSIRDICIEIDLNEKFELTSNKGLSCI